MGEDPGPKGSEEARDEEADRSGEVWVAAERVKKRAESDSSDSISRSLALKEVSGDLEAASSSFWFKVERLEEAVSYSACRAEDRLATMGSIIYLFVP